MVMDCVWSEPIVDRGQLQWEQKSGRVTFQDLVIEQDRQRVFLFDADRAKKKCEDEAISGPLRASFRSFWLAPKYAGNEAWMSLRERFAQRGLNLPLYRSSEPEFLPMIDTLYSVK